MKPLCIYHGNCADGFGAAWAVRHALGDGNVDFHAGFYGAPPPDVSGRDVILVDFSYKRPVLFEMAPLARSILILDHHKTAAEDLAGFPKPPGLWNSWVSGQRFANSETIAALFDMNRSGAGLAWEFFHPGEAMPYLLAQIEDRDLWRFKLPQTREVNATLFSYPYDFEVWDKLMVSPIHTLATEGAAIERKHHKDITELLAVTTRTMKIGGHVVKVANLPYTMSSDAAGILAEGAPFGACYWDTPTGRVFSLRSRDGGIDVSEVAKAFGGGGHKAASGFTAPAGWEGEP